MWAQFFSNFQQLPVETNSLPVWLTNKSTLVLLLFITSIRRCYYGWCYYYCIDGTVAADADAALLWRLSSFSLTLHVLRTASLHLTLHWLHFFHYIIHWRACILQNLGVFSSISFKNGTILTIFLLQNVDNFLLISLPIMFFHIFTKCNCNSIVQHRNSPFECYVHLCIQLSQYLLYGN